MKIRWQIVARCGNAPTRNEKCHRSPRLRDRQGPARPGTCGCACSKPYQLFAAPAVPAAPRQSRSRTSCPLARFLHYPYPYPHCHPSMYAHAIPSVCMYRVGALSLQYVHRGAAHNNHSLASSFHETVTRKRTEIPRLTGTPKIAGFREDPGARLLLNAPCWHQHQVRTGQQRCVIKPDMGTPPHIHRAHCDEIDAVSSILPPRAYF